MLNDYQGRRRPVKLVSVSHQKMDRRQSAVWDHCPLTRRQLEIIQLCAEGLNWPQIAEELHVQRKTPIEALQRARKKLGLGGTMNRTQIVAIAMREGWIQ